MADIRYQLTYELAASFFGVEDRIVIRVTYVTSPELLTASLKYEHKMILNRIIAKATGCEFNVSLGRWTDSGSCRALSLVKNFFPQSCLSPTQDFLLLMIPD